MFGSVVADAAIIQPNITENIWPGWGLKKHKNGGAREKTSGEKRGENTDDTPPCRLGAHIPLSPTPARTLCRRRGLNAPRPRPPRLTARSACSQAAGGLLASSRGGGAPAAARGVWWGWGGCQPRRRLRRAPRAARPSSYVTPSSPTLPFPCSFEPLSQRPWHSPTYLAPSLLPAPLRKPQRHPTLPPRRPPPLLRVGLNGQPHVCVLPAAPPLPPCGGPAH